jgi:Holliday junction resolvase-like predicted endonuclease
MPELEVTKISGEREAFSKEKLCGSLVETGAPQPLVDRVCTAVENELTPGISTSEIFRTALRHLALENNTAASRYNLKRGIAMLGPAGFLFEQFVETILQALGYTTQRNIIEQGSCVSHEIDVYAEKAHERVFIEAKYHNATSIKTHVDVVMYADARLQDLVRAAEQNEKNGALYRMWVFTNTKFTSASVRYAECRGLTLTGWKYPKGEGLEDLVTRYALYPVTVLPSVDDRTMRILAEHNMMLAQDLAPYSAEDLARSYGIDIKRTERLVAEAGALVYGTAKATTNI